MNDSFSFSFSYSSFLPIIIIIKGNVINDKQREIVIPTLIISPRLITGSIFDKIKDANPTTVVIMAKNDGSSFDKTVFITSLY